MTEPIFASAKEGTTVDDYGVFTSIAPARTTSTGKKFTDGILNHGEDSVNVRIWDVDKIPDLEVGKAIKFVVKVGSYNGNRQYTLDFCALAPTVPIEELLPHSYWKMSQMKKDIRTYIESIQNPLYKKVVKGCYNETEIYLKNHELTLSEMPAAISIHHAFLGGLFTHTLSMIRQAEGILTTTIYKTIIDRDLLISGILLHDLGKAYCYKSAIDHESTMAGQLLEHIAIVDGLINQEIGTLMPYSEQFSNIEVLKLRHVVLSHHGKNEWGSPIEPELPEAWLLHQVDKTDATMEIIREVKQQTPVNEFSGKNFALNGNRILNVEPENDGESNI